MYKTVIPKSVVRFLEVQLYHDRNCVRIVANHLRMLLVILCCTHQSTELKLQQVFQTLSDHLRAEDESKQINKHFSFY